MRYLVDTDWVIDYLKGKPAALTLLSRLSDEGIGISIITYGEIYEGIYFGGKQQSTEDGFGYFIQSTNVLTLTFPIMKRFARIRGNLRARGQLISDPDLLIAATALEHDLILVTRNVGHFERIPDLQLWSGKT